MQTPPPSIPSILSPSGMPAAGAFNRRGGPHSKTLVIDRLIGQPDDPRIQIESPRGVELCHKHRDHFFLWVNDERRVLETAPVIPTYRAKLRQILRLAIDTEAEAVAHVFDLSLNVILGH